MRVSDFKGKQGGALLCPLCENRFVSGANGRWTCSQHKDTTITMWQHEKDSGIRDVELRFKHTKYACLWFDLELETTHFMIGQTEEAFNEIIDLEVQDYTLEEIKKIMFWA